MAKVGRRRQSTDRRCGYGPRLGSCLLCPACSAGKLDSQGLSIFWIKPVALAYNLGYPPRELRRIESIITEHQQELMEAWNEYFRT
ncbi:MAG: DUF4160 domain-containing protein [Deltaproteobacteria bacterium]|nr:MAG: DUF4160 domain-containing protein [Deltaproteobacteria bacterium]